MGMVNSMRSALILGGEFVPKGALSFEAEPIPEFSSDGSSRDLHGR